MNKINTRKRSKSYFYITEDSPLPAVQQQEITGIKVPLPKSQHYFFIDFASNCQLRLMNKIQHKEGAYSHPLKIQQYGRNVVTNMEDCSPRSLKLMRFQEERNRFKQKKRTIRHRLNYELNKSKEKKRICSSLAIKQRLIDHYTSSITVDQEVQKSRLATISSRLQSQQSAVLKRLGLLHER